MLGVLSVLGSEGEAARDVIRRSYKKDAGSAICVRFVLGTAASGGWEQQVQRAAAEASRDVYQAALAAAGRGAITSEILEAEAFYYAEDYHQQYLAKNPTGYCGVGGPEIDPIKGLIEDPTEEEIESSNNVEFQKFINYYSEVPTHISYPTFEVINQTQKYHLTLLHEVRFSPQSAGKPCVPLADYLA